MEPGATIPTRELFIDGRWVRPMRGNRIDVINPATESYIGSIPAGNEEDVQNAVSAATRAHQSGVWGRLPGATRAEVLRRIAEAIRQDKPRLARLETLDCGKPIAEAEWDMDDVAATFDLYAGMAEDLDKRQGEPLEVPMKEFSCRMRYEPLGVVGLITPWNYPLLMATWKIAPALAAGCTIVHKPSEHASVTCLELAAIAAQAGVPPGVFNVVTGLGAEAGAALAGHPGLAKVSFTGSVPTGRSVALSAAKNVRPAGLELGGKSALIVFEDADVAKAVEWCMFGVFWTNGQICSSTSRLLVHESVAPQFYERLRTRAKSIKVSDPLEQDCRMGPLVNRLQHSKVLQHIAAAKEQGATLLTGGRRPPHLSKGFYVEPTVFVGVKPHMKIWTEEVFGPVLACATFRTEHEAVQLANASEFGLAAAVISRDMDRCNRVASLLECGIVWVNCSQPCFPQAPWGGVKNSGYGRDLGKWGLENYLSPKQVTTYVAEGSWEWYPGYDAPLGGGGARM